jgi:protoporphyrinogen oxidase
MKKVIIIGAGPAGLTAGYDILSKSSDYEVTIIEETPYVGGLCARNENDDISFDAGGHMYISENPKINKFWNAVLPMQGSPSKDDLTLDRYCKISNGGPNPNQVDDVFLSREKNTKIYKDGKFYDNPVKLNKEAIKNMGLSASLKSSFSQKGASVFKRKEKSLEDYMINRYGKELYNLFLEEYVDKVWGKHPSRIFSEWGDIACKDLIAPVINVEKNSGKCNKTDAPNALRYYYPKYGSYQLWESCADRFIEMGGSVHKNCKVTGIYQANDKILNVKCYADGDEFNVPCDYLISTMPLRDLVLSMNDIDGHTHLAAENLCYRGLVSVNVELSDILWKNTDSDIKTVNNIIPDSVIYIDNPNVKVARIQIYNNFSPYLNRDDHYVTLGLNYYCNEGDYYWNLNDRDFRKLVESELIKLGIIRNNQWIMKYSTVRFNKAFPCYYDGYENVEALKKFVDGFENLYCIGRNGQHRFSNVEQTMNTSFECVKNILNNTKNKENVWTVNDCNEGPESEKVYNSALLSGEGEYRGNYVPIQKKIENNKSEDSEYVPPRRMRRPMMTPIKKADPEGKLSEAVVLDNSVVIAARPGVSIPIDPNMEPVIPMDLESSRKDEVLEAVEAPVAETVAEKVKTETVPEAPKAKEVREVAKSEETSEVVDVYRATSAPVPPMPNSYKPENSSENKNEDNASETPRPTPRLRRRKMFTPVNQEAPKEVEQQAVETPNVETQVTEAPKAEAPVVEETKSASVVEVPEMPKVATVAEVPSMPKAVVPAEADTSEVPENDASAAHRIPTMEEVKTSLIFPNSVNAPSYRTVSNKGVAVVEPFEAKVKEKVDEINAANEKAAPKKIDSDLSAENSNSVKISKVVDRAGSALVTNQSGPKIEYDYMSTKNAFSKKTVFGDEDRFNEESTSKLKKPTGPIPEFAKVQKFNSDIECDNALSVPGERFISREQAKSSTFSSSPVSFSKASNFAEGNDVDKANPHERIIQKDEKGSERVGLKRASSFVDAADVKVIERPNAREDMLKELHGEGEVDELGLGGFGLNKPEKTKLQFAVTKEEPKVVEETIEEVQQVEEVVETIAEPVEEIVEAVVEPVQETIEAVEETVVEEPVEETVEEPSSYNDIDDFEVQSDYASELSEQYAYVEPVTYADDISDVESAREYEEETTEEVETSEDITEEVIEKTVEEPVEVVEESAEETEVIEEVVEETTEEIIEEPEIDEETIEEETTEESVEETVEEKITEDTVEEIEASSADKEAYEELLEYETEKDAEIVDYNEKTAEIVEAAQEEDDDSLSKINEQAASRAIVKPWSSKYHGSAEPEVREVIEETKEEKTSKNINEAHNFFGNTGVDNYPRVRLNEDGNLEKKEELKEHKEEKKESGMHIIKESNPNSLVGATDRFSTELIKRDVIEEDEGFTIDRGPIPLKKKSKHKFNPFFGKKDKPAKGGISLVDEPSTSEPEVSASVENTVKPAPIEEPVFEEPVFNKPVVETPVEKIVEEQPVAKKIEVPVFEETNIDNSELEEPVFELPKFVKSFKDKPSFEKTPEEKAVDDLIASDVLDDKYVDEKLTVENILSESSEIEDVVETHIENEVVDVPTSDAQDGSVDATEETEEVVEETKSVEEQFDEFMAQLDEELGLAPAKPASNVKAETIVEKKPEPAVQNKLEDIIEKKPVVTAEKVIEDPVPVLPEIKEEPRVDSFVNATKSDFNEAKSVSETKTDNFTSATPKPAAPVYKDKNDFLKKEIDTSIVFKNARVIKTTKISHMKEEEPQEIKREKVYSDKEKVIAVIKNGEYIPVKDTVEEKEAPQEKKPASTGKSKQSRKKRKNNKSSNNKAKETEEDYVGTPISVMLDAKEAAEMQAPLENPVRRDRNYYKHN